MYNFFLRQVLSLILFHINITLAASNRLFDITNGRVFDWPGQSEEQRTSPRSSYSRRHCLHSLRIYLFLTPCRSSGTRSFYSEPRKFALIHSDEIPP